MTRRWIAQAALLVCAFVLLTVVAPLAAAQDRPAKATVSIALCETARNGAITARASGGGALAVGESATRYVYADAGGNRIGQISAGSPDTVGRPTGGVMGGVSGGVAPALPPTPPRQVMDHLWQADTKVVSIDVDTVTFELDWKRSDLKDGTLQFARGDHRTITLRQGEKHLLDFIPLSPDARDANMFVEVEAEPVEDAALRNVILGYDLWLVHQTADGVKTTRHAVVTGRQGEKVSFNFAPVPLAIDAAAAAGADSPFRLYVNGTITGRQSSDGSIQIALQSTRKNGTPEGVYGFEGGTKTFSAKADETISIAIPPYYGRSGWAVDAGFRLTTPKPGVSLADGSIRIDLGTFFDGATTSILVTAHRER